MRKAFECTLLSVLFFNMWSAFSRPTCTRQLCCCCSNFQSIGMKGATSKVVMGAVKKLPEIDTPSIQSWLQIDSPSLLPPLFLIPAHGSRPGPSVLPHRSLQGVLQGRCPGPTGGGERRETDRGHRPVPGALPRLPGQEVSSLGGTLRCTRVILWECKRSHIFCYDEEHTV